jgi:hypothetical protein
MSRMDSRSSQSVRDTEHLLAAGLLAVLGGLAFWLWRQNAPLARHLPRHNPGKRNPV